MSAMAQGGVSLKDFLEGNLTSFEDSTITTLRAKAAIGYSTLQSVSLPHLTTANSEAFSQCGNLSEIYFPELVQAATRMFNECQSLTDINVTAFPSLANIGQYGFYNCQHLVSADFDSLTRIQAGAFSRCFLLASLTLRSPTVCVLDNISAFNDTPFRGRNSKVGTLYVPSSLVESYKSAENWKTLYEAGTCEIVAIGS